jgi:uncharacterized protein YjbI with pentapeptide repeats
VKINLKFILRVRVITTIKNMQAEELLRRYASGERDFSNIQLEYTDELSDANLSGINLSNSHIDELFLQGINLSGANLKESDFGQTCLRGANLRGADLTGADLSHANLDSADLTGAKLTNAYIRTTTMIGANLTDADLTGTKFIKEMVEHSIFCRTIMPDGSIYDGNI